MSIFPTGELARIAVALERIASCLEGASGQRGDTLSFSYTDTEGDAPYVGVMSDAELEEHFSRRARFEEATGKRMAPWEEVPPDFEG